MEEETISKILSSIPKERGVLMGNYSILSYGNIKGLENEKELKKDTAFSTALKKIIKPFEQLTYSDKLKFWDSIGFSFKWIDFRIEKNDKEVNNNTPVYKFSIIPKIYHNEFEEVRIYADWFKDHLINENPSVFDAEQIIAFHSDKINEMDSSIERKLYVKSLIEKYENKREYMFRNDFKHKITHLNTYLKGYNSHAVKEDLTITFIHDSLSELELLFEGNADAKILLFMKDLEEKLNNNLSLDITGKMKGLELTEKLLIISYLQSVGKFPQYDNAKGLFTQTSLYELLGEIFSVKPDTIEKSLKRVNKIMQNIETVKENKKQRIEYMKNVKRVLSLLHDTKIDKEIETTIKKLNSKTL